MDKLNGVVSEAPGAEEVKGNGKVLTLGQVKEMLRRDVHSCLLMLQAVHDDKDVLEILASALLGKYLNALHQKDLEKQQDLKI